MQGFVWVLRQLWRRRLIVAIGMWLGLIAGVMTGYHIKWGIPPELESRKYRVGLASASVLVDSPVSQTVAVGGNPGNPDVASLSSRANLLANLMTSSPLKDRIAATAGLGDTRLVGRAPASGTPLELSPVEREGSDRRAHLLTVYVNETLPIITADAQAPTAEVAARISTAAVTELEAYLSAVATADGVPAARQLHTEALGPARSVSVARGPRAAFILGAFVLTVGLWCAGILAVTVLARGWREAAANDDATPAQPPDDPPGVVADAAPDGEDDLLEPWLHDLDEPTPHARFSPPTLSER